MQVQVMTKPICQHCRRRYVTRTRGLCSPCYGNLDIRKLYPCKISCSVAEEPPRPTREPRPTSALPGTEEKVQELIRRVWAGEHLWHDDDAQWDGEVPHNLLGGPMKYVPKRKEDRRQTLDDEED